MIAINSQHKDRPRVRILNGRVYVFTPRVLPKDKRPLKELLLGDFRDQCGRPRRDIQWNP